MKVAVSIVSYNTKDLLETCLKILSDNSNEYKLGVYVVDNASSDGSADMVKEKFPKVELIRNEKNVGFAKAHNQVLKITNAEYVLIINPDTEFNAKDIDKLVEFMEENPECGVSSVKLTNLDGSLQSNGGDLPFNLALVSWLFNLESLGIKTNFHRMDEDYYKSTHEVGWLSGTFMFIRSSVFKRVGYFNDEIFMYFEDTEFSYLVKKAGFKLMIVPEIVVKHISGASSENPRLRQWLGEYKGLIYFYNKYFGLLPALFVRLLIYKVTILRIIAFSLFGKFDFAKTYLKVLLSV